MKTIKAILILLVLFSTIALTSCSSGRGIGGSSKKCGCGITKGMSGY
jgi:predicted small secreted protein